MKASIIALAGVAAVASAQNSTVPWTTSTVYSTRTQTISECASTITNCPYKAHPVTTEIVDVYTTYCPVAATETSAASKPPHVVTWTPPAQPTSPGTPPAHPYSSKQPGGPASPPMAPSSPPSPPTSPHKPSGVVTVITISTCVPTVITSVITVTPAPSQPSGPASTGLVSPHKNSTMPLVPVTGAASSTKVGGLFMAVGLLAAFL